MKLKISMKMRILGVIQATLSAGMTVLGIFTLAWHEDPTILAVGVLSFLVLGVALQEDLKTNSPPRK